MADKQFFWIKAFRMVIKLAMPLVFLITGLVLLYIATPGWSIILGIPSTVFGIVFSLYAYDSITGQMNYDEAVEELARKKLIPQ